MGVHTLFPLNMSPLLSMYQAYQESSSGRRNPRRSCQTRSKQLLSFQLDPTLTSGR